MGKGSGRRPAQIPRAEYEENYDRMFPPKPRTKYEPPPLVEEKPAEQ
jgi:hypothetical protein